MTKNLPTVWGATQQDWDFFSQELGLTEDLLPVVSNLKAKISPQSAISGVGKVPSVYNHKGFVVGYSGWTTKHTKPGELSAWASQTDYGLSVQTRNLRVVDVDVEDNKANIDSIYKILRSYLGEKAPIRFRENSTKCIFPFFLEGEYGKRKFDTDGGQVEFLANGQQFVACGTHPSGARYEWENLEADNVPTLTPEQFEKMWDELVLLCSTSEEVREGAVSGLRGENLHMKDAIRDYLFAAGLVLGEDPVKGYLYIDCPWKNGHSGDTGPQQTAYMPKGTRSVERGAFKCFHASCQGHPESEWLLALGYSSDGVDEIPLEYTDGMIMPDFPVKKLEIKSPEKNPRVKGIISNVIDVLKTEAFLNRCLTHDEFINETLIRPWNSVGAPWVPLSDLDIVNLQYNWERRLPMPVDPVSTNMMDSAVMSVAFQNRVDSAHDWVTGLKWDGERRIESFFPKYAFTEDTDYAHAIGLYWWTALAGRCYEANVKADMMVILQGQQGCGKSTAFEAMCPHPDMFSTVDFGLSDADFARSLHGKLIVESGELKGMSKREAAHVKALLTKTRDNYTPKYKNREISVPRRCVFAGTTNEDEFLRDSTGERRFLPIEVCIGGEKFIDSDGIFAIRDQLWAEGLEMYRKHGVMYQRAEATFQEAHDKYRVADLWEDKIAEWLRASMRNDEEGNPILNGDRDFIPTADIADGLGLTTAQVGAYHAQRISDCMKHLGYKPVRGWVDGHRCRGFRLAKSD